MAASDLASDRTSRFRISYGKHPVQGLEVRREPRTVNGVSRWALQMANGKGPWDAMERLYVAARDVTADSTTTFHQGLEDDATDPLWPNERAHPWTSYTSILTPQYVTEADVEKVFGIYRTLRMARYNGAGVQVDADNNPIGGGDPRNYYVYSVNPADETADQIVRWGKRLPVIINWPELVDWRDYNKEVIGWDDAKNTPRSVRAVATIGGGGTVPAGTYYIRMSTMVGADESSASDEIVVVLGAPGKITLTWDMKSDAAPTDFRVYYANLENQQHTFKLVGAGGAVRAATLLNLAGASAGDPRETASNALLRQIPRFESHIFFTAPYDLSLSLDRIMQISCSEWQWSKAKVRVLSPATRAPVFTIDRANMGGGTFKTFPIDRRQRPNQIIGLFRNLDDPFLDVDPDPVVVNRLTKQLAEGRVKAYTIDFGCALRSQVQRACEYWARVYIDNDQMAEVDATPRSYHVLPGDNVRITNNTPNWTDVLFKLIQKKERGETKAGDYWMCQLTTDPLYSDTAHGPFPRPLPASPTDPFSLPPAVQDVSITEHNVLEADATIVTQAQIDVTFAPFERQQVGLVYYKLASEDDTKWRGAGIVSPDQTTRVGSTIVSGFLVNQPYVFKVVTMAGLVTNTLAESLAYPFTFTGKLDAPSAPPSGTATPNKAYTSLQLDWVQSVDLDIRRYKIVRLIGAVESFVGYVGGDTTRLVENTLPLSGTRTYKVYAENWSGVSSADNPDPTKRSLTITFTAAVYPSPTISILRISNDAIITWTPGIPTVGPTEIEEIYPLKIRDSSTNALRRELTIDLPDAIPCKWTYHDGAGNQSFVHLDRNGTIECDAGQGGSLTYWSQPFYGSGDIEWSVDSRRMGSIYLYDANLLAGLGVTIFTRFAFTIFDPAENEYIDRDGGVSVVSPNKRRLAPLSKLGIHIRNGQAEYHIDNKPWIRSAYPPIPNAFIIAASFFETSLANEPQAMLQVRFRPHEPRQFIYTEAMQVRDFGSVPATIKVEVSQTSSLGLQSAVATLIG